MARYLIEFRFRGKARNEMKKLIREVNGKFKLKNPSRKRPIPHVSIVAPFSTNNQRRLVRDFHDTCKKFKLIKFKFNGFGFFDEKRVAFVDIKPSEGLKDFRLDLIKKIKKYSELEDYDKGKSYSAHATINRNIDRSKFNKVKKYLLNKKGMADKHNLIRVTLIKGGKILYEYDFMLERLLTRRQAKSKGLYKKTMGIFKSGNHPKKEIAIELGLFDKIKRYFRGSRTYVISDLHLDHKNVIRFCKRPFKSLNAMNKILIGNWNNIVRPKDNVYFLGDLAYGKGSKSTDYWLNKLNGNITFIKGNHDRSDKIDFYENKIVEYRGERFYLVHRPDEIPSDWKGWSIIGHVHNNDLENFPFINYKKKIINVGG